MPQEQLWRAIMTTMMPHRSSMYLRTRNQCYLRQCYEMLRIYSLFRWTLCGTKIHQSRLPKQVSSLSTSKPTSRPRSEPRVFPTKGYDVIDADQLIEEEDIPEDNPDRFYPVKLGEIFNARYQTVSKLGYGSSSTIWLARDLE